MRDLESGHWSMTELCERYGVTRPTGYKWLARHLAGGSPASSDRTRAPQRCPHRTGAALEELIVAARVEYGWGAKKLTVTDHFSRRVLACHGLRSVKAAGAKPVFRALFREVGLPHAIRTDNGAPFASTGIHGLTTLNVWWMQLGIVHQRITPGNPHENGAHERMHRELKRETARPAAASLRAQQRRFDTFRQRYNDERPHEGIGDRTPNSLWRPSPRPYPEHRTYPDYPAHLEVRRVSTAGTFRLLARQPFLSSVNNVLGLYQPAG